jgi:cobyrinic acid a,c-diamide synthase
MYDKPRGHGYSEAVVDEDNTFYKEGTLLRGHEFHYSEVSSCNPWIKTSLSIQRGTGSLNKRDGLIYKNVFATYIHIHALANPQWVSGMIKAAKRYKSFKKSKNLIEG